MDIVGVLVKELEVEYDWEALGAELADASDREQGAFLVRFAADLKRVQPGQGSGIMQIEYLSQWLRGLPNAEAEDIESVKWLLRELLERLEGDD